MPQGKFLLLLGILFFSSLSFSQKIASKSMMLKVGKDTVLSDFCIEPNSFYIVGVDSSFYRLNPFKASIFWNKQKCPSIKSDSLRAYFRVFPFLSNRKRMFLSYDSVLKRVVVSPSYSIKQQETEDKNGLFDAGKLNYNGSYGRSLSIGNNQDAVLNSQLNLQMQGYVGDSIEVNAAITDNNIQIQPEGNTQHLSDFDRVFLQFKKTDWKINIGDIDLRKKNSNYLSFYKRIQGIAFDESISARNFDYFSVAAAVAKGRFTRNIFQGTEGNQGPYRLTGANNELYFLVLANTERVFMDGELLQRGADNDYVINYNTAEITFMPKRLVNKDKRIQVEFEYSDKNYLNYMTFCSQTFQRKNYLVSLGYYRNADAKNTSVNQALDDPKKKFLYDIGDSTQDAFYLSASRENYSNGKILYAKASIPNTQDSFYYYSTSPDSAFYNLSFVFVGEGKGDYLPLYAGVNGKVYQYVSPVGNEKKGNYEPAIFLVAPKLYELFNANSSVSLGKYGRLSCDVALSHNDINTFSSKDKKNDWGGALNFKISGRKPFGDNEKVFLYQSGLDYSGLNFKTVERLRSVEFLREWGLPLNSPQSRDWLPSWGMGLLSKKRDSIVFRQDFYFRIDGYKGVRQNIEAAYLYNSWKAFGNIQITFNKRQNASGQFFKPSITLENYSFPSLLFGAIFNAERNSLKSEAMDTLTGNSYSFYNYNFYLKTRDWKKGNILLEYNQRRNYLPMTKQFLLQDFSHNYRLASFLQLNKKEQIKSEFSFRQLIRNLPIPATMPQENNYTLRTEYFFDKIKGLASGSCLYETGAGTEQKRDISYISVPTGRGQYTWLDNNHDGIAQLNEFEPAKFTDQANYIRIFTPSNEYVKSYYSQINYFLRIQPAKYYGRSKRMNRLPKILVNFEFRSTFQLNQKQSRPLNNFLPNFHGTSSDTFLLSQNKSSLNTLSYNRNSPIWGTDLIFNTSATKSLLTYGPESKYNTELIHKIRYTLKKNLIGDITSRLAQNSASANLFLNKNYKIDIKGVEPKITINFLQHIRTQFGCSILKKNNQTSGNEVTASFMSANAEARYSSGNNFFLQGKATYQYIGYEGSSNPTLDFILLDGLSKGKNFLWSVDLSKRILKSFELVLHYEGRKPGEQRIIHNGTASVRALL